MQVARSVARGSRRGAKGGVPIEGPNQLFCIRPATEAFRDEQPSLGCSSKTLCALAAISLAPAEPVLMLAAGIQAPGADVGA
jgi:hypothetical protein